MVSVSMISSDLWPEFQGCTIFRNQTCQNGAW